MKSRLIHPCTEDISGPGKSVWLSSILPIQPRVTLELQHWDSLCCLTGLLPQPPYPRALPGHAREDILPWCGKHDLEIMPTPPHCSTTHMWNSPFLPHFRCWVSNWPLLTQQDAVYWELNCSAPGPLHKHHDPSQEETLYTSCMASTIFPAWSFSVSPTPGYNAWSNCSRQTHKPLL